MAKGKLVSTRRIAPSGTVHEMAHFGTGYLCRPDRDAPEPWVWTEKRVTCGNCRRAMGRRHAN